MNRIIDKVDNKPTRVVNENKSRNLLQQLWNFSNYGTTLMITANLKRKNLKVEQSQEQGKLNDRP